MKKNYLIPISIIFLAGFLIYTTIKFFQIKPFLNNLFENADNLAYNQKLTDSTIVFYDERDNRIELSLKDSLCFNFFSISQTEFENKLSDSCFNIQTNFKLDLVKFKAKYNITGQLYKCDTSCLPFKYKKINMPYKLKVFNYKIIESKINN